jgi:hypothetical protein
MHTKQFTITVSATQSKHAYKVARQQYPASAPRRMNKIFDEQRACQWRKPTIVAVKRHLPKLYSLTATSAATVRLQ